MAESIYTGPKRRGQTADICMLLMAPPLLSASILMITQLTNGIAGVVGCGLLFFAVSMLLLAGDVFRRIVYCFFLVQFAAAHYLPLALAATITSLLFLPLTFDKARLKEISIIPNVKPLLLLLSGCAVSLIYQVIVNHGDLKYFLSFDILFMFGLVFAYELFILFKLKALDPKKLIPCIAASGLVVICFIIALYQMKEGLGLILNERFGVSTVISPNILSSYLDLALPCAFFSAFFEKRSVIKKVLFYALSLIYVVAILMAASRGSLPGIVIIAAYIIWRKRSKLLLLAAFVCAVIVFSTIGMTVVDRMFKPDMTDMMSNVGRVELLRSAFKVIQENHYFFGIGMNNFSLMKFDYGFPMWFDSKQVMSSHNFFVEIWLGWGMLGLLGWIALNISTVIPLVRKHKDNGTACAVMFALAAFSMHGLFDSVLANYSIMLAYFSLLGVGLFLTTQTNCVADNLTGVNSIERANDETSAV
jgi:O-antigen ligase